MRASAPEAVLRGGSHCKASLSSRRSSRTPCVTALPPVTGSASRTARAFRRINKRVETMRLTGRVPLGTTHSLSPIDLARFIRGRVEAGESNTTIANRLVIDPTTVAHHLALLALPPVLDAALKSGRCASPRTLYELTKLHVDQPERVAELVNGSEPITHDAVAGIRDAAPVAFAPVCASTPTPPRPDRTAQTLARATGRCQRLDAALLRLTRTGIETVPPTALGSLDCPPTSCHCLPAAAAARRGGPGVRFLAESPVVRRASLQPGCEVARRDADRASRVAASPGRHVGLCHARPRRGACDVGRDHRDA